MKKNTLNITQNERIKQLEEENLFLKNQINDAKSSSFNENEFFQYFDFLKVGVLIHWDNRIIYYNKFCKDLFGIPVEVDLIGESPLNLIKDSDLEKVKNRIKDVMNGVHVPAIQQEMKKYNSVETIHVLLSSNLISINNNNYLLVIFNDISEHQRLLDKLAKSDERLKALYNIKNYSYKTEKDVIVNIIEEAESISSSKISFFHFVDKDIVNLTLIAWSKNTLTQCTADYTGIYPISEAGIWVECLKTRTPMIYNDYEKVPNKRGLPIGHFPLKRFMTIPIMDEGQIVAICGVGNKEIDYDDNDMRQLSIFLDSMWSRIKSLRAEQRIIESEEKYRNIIEKANDGVMIISNKTITFVNNKLCQLTGYSKEELLNRDFFTLYDMESSKKIIKYYTLRKDDEKNVPSTYEVVLKTKNRQLVFAEQSVNVMNFNDIFSELIFIRDISHRKQQELELLKLSKAIESSPTSIVITNIDGIIEYINPKFTELTGYLHSEVIGKNPSILKSGLTPNETYENLWNTIIQGKTWKGEIQNKKKNGELFWELATISSIKDNNGQIQNYIAIKEDITFIKEKESELLHRNTNLRLLNECHIALLSCDDETEMFFAFSDVAVTILGYELAMICEYQSIGEDHYLKVLSFSYNILVKNLFRNQTIEISSNFGIISAIEKNELYKCFHDNKTECFINKIFESSFKSVIVVPLVKQRVDKQVLLLFKKQQVGVDDSKIHLIYELVNYIDFSLDILKEKQEKKRLEEIHLLEKEQLNVTLNTITDAVISVNKEGFVNFVNNSTIKLLDLEELDIWGKRIFDLIDIYDLTDNRVLFNPFDFAEDDGDYDSYKSRYILINKSNHKKYVQFSVKKIYDRKSLFIGVLIVIRDITKLVKIEMQSALSQKMESVGQLASGIAHEINTPMQFVGDNTYFLKDGFESISEYLNLAGESLFTNTNPDITSILKELSVKYEEMEIDYYKNEIPIAIDRTLQGIDRVRKIVTAMKNFAHSSGKMKAQSNINQGIEVTITITKNEWKYIAEVVSELDPNMPPVFCSLDEINQVVLNMIINSSHAIAEKMNKEENQDFKGIIRIKTYFNELNGFIEISDNGDGIPANKLNRIFDPFFTTKEVGKGTGQGLSIAHDIIVNKHNGSIDVESKVGIGTKFIIRIPING